ncbi:MAG: heavy metal-binding domain-containing protein [Desulfococcaceae bacterium]|jgi:uncharacterized protein YbjQ (UPF0145 family)|nr:heavy metal-binding domain-containing protein [Desulfococcaceae bacterium]
MPDKKYNLIFEGKTVEGQQRGRVAKNLMALLKTDEKGVKRLFSGQPAIIKKNLDSDKAKKYKTAMNTAGALCRIEEIGGTASPPPPAIKNKKGPSAPEAADAENGKPEMILCPHCNYRQKNAERCIMCGGSITEIIEAAPQIQPMKNHRPIQRLPKAGEILLTNTESVPGREIVEHFGLVSGNTIRARHMGKYIIAGLKNLLGGELKEYTILLQESREQAIERMKEQARQLGANAIINVRFSTSSVTRRAAELCAYGTAIRIK